MLRAHIQSVGRWLVLGSCAAVAAVASSRLDSGSIPFTDVYGATGRYRLSVPADAGPSSPKCLALYLHGDGANDFDSGFREVRREAGKYGCMALSVLAPKSASGCGAPNGRCWWTAAPRNALFLDTLLAAVNQRFRIDRKRVLFAGASGGPTFLAGYYLPFHGKGFGGGAMLGCGGQLTALAQNGIRHGPDPREFSVRIATSSLDRLRGGADGVRAEYVKAGFDVRYSEARGKEHCRFDQPFGSMLAEEAARVFGRTSPRLVSPDIDDFPVPKGKDPSPAPDAPLGRGHSGLQ